MLIYSGASLFRILLAIAFGYLSLQALQNGSRFALVAGLLLTWNLGEWTSDLLLERRGANSRSLDGRWVRFVLGLALVFWMGALVTDQFYLWTGERRHFLLREQPFEFAHEAIRFAGQAEQPDRALVYGLGQTGLFDFCNAPAHKPFMDGRLEMPDRQTFQTYIDVERWLQESDPRWEPAVHQMGDPLILLTHQQNYKGEALLLTHPGWRCVYFDALASVFLPRKRLDLEPFYPTIDFATRHFCQTKAASIPDLPGAPFREMRALYNLGTALRPKSSATWEWRIPAMFLALDRAALALSENPTDPAVWTLMGNCYWNLVPDLRKPPPVPADQWDPATGLPWAQATYCYRRALGLAPANVTALRYLYEAFKVRHMADSQLEIGHSLIATGQASRDQVADIARLDRLLGSVPDVSRTPEKNLKESFDVAIRTGRPEAALLLAEQAWDARGGITWAMAERVAPVYLHLGRPADARRVWLEATEPPSRALRFCPEAVTYWVERDFDNAGRPLSPGDRRPGRACRGMVGIGNAKRGTRPGARYCRSMWQSTSVATDKPATSGLGRAPVALEESR